MKKKRRGIKIFLLLLLLVIISIVYYVFLQMGKLPAPMAYDGLSYYADSRFVSPRELRSCPEKTTGGKGGWSRFFFKSENAPSHPLPKVKLTKEQFAAIPHDLGIYWLGHSSAIVELNGKRLLVDPVFANAGPFPGITKRYDEPPLNRKELPQIDYVVITHDHYDHLEYHTIRYLRNKNVLFIVPLGVDARLKSWGVPEEKIHAMGWDEFFGDGNITITSLRTVHYSGRSRSDRNTTLWTSYVFEGGNKKVFWSGDSGYGGHYAMIGEKYGPFDIACVEIDGWNPGWPDTHLFPEEVIRVTQDVKADVLFPLHWGTFDLAMHPWDESIRQVTDLAATEGIELATPLMGEFYQPGTKTKHWWLSEYE